MKTLITEDMFCTKDGDGVRWYACPSCSVLLVSDEMHYCPNCGIPITLNEEEAEDMSLDYDPNEENLYVKNCTCGEIVEVIGYKCHEPWIQSIKVRCANCGEFVEVEIEVD